MEFFLLKQTTGTVMQDPVVGYRGRLLVAGRRRQPTECRCTLGIPGMAAVMC